jgi:predicted phage terminase large subunit-like protein
MSETTRLLDFIPTLSPEFKPPFHLADWVRLIERAASEPVRGLCSIPIRHYKTETTLHGIVWLLKQDPTIRVIFLTHDHKAAEARGKRLRQLAKAAGVGPERGYDTIVDWRNDEGGGVVVMSADQSKLGYDCHVLVFDDPLDERGAQDPKQREEVDATIVHYTARCMRAGKPGPVLGVMSRWHPDDPIGRRLQRAATRWDYFHGSAVLDEGTDHERAFAPEVWGLEELRKMRAELAEADPTERLWWAQFMNEPRPMGADLFGPPTYYDKLPDFAYRVAAGADFAFTVKDGSDWFAHVVARMYGAKLYLLEASRFKLETHLIESTLRASQNKHGRHMVFSYQSGPEVGISRLLQERGIPMTPIHARYSKLVRAQRTISRWNAGQVLLPNGAPWVKAFLHRLGMFRGHEHDSDDDEVDALVSLSDGLQGGMVAAPKTMGRRPSPW